MREPRLLWMTAEMGSEKSTIIPSKGSDRRFEVGFERRDIAVIIDVGIAEIGAELREHCGDECRLADRRVRREPPCV